MQASEYQRAARTTAIYPAAAGVYYPALGLSGELGELCNKAKKIIRGDVTFDARLEDFRKELGDVLWYIAATASDRGFALADLVADAECGQQLTGDLYSTLLDLEKSSGDLAGMADEIKTHGISVYRRQYTQSRLEQVLRGCGRLCFIFNVNMNDVCKANIQKLFYRKEAGTIKGDGDNR